jgi:ABC-type Fe3+ transport system substrate-binding protein
MARKRHPVLSAWIFVLSVPLAFSTDAADSASTRPKQDTDARGYVSVASHDELVARAKKEGKLRATSSLGDEARKAMAEAFRAEYPFIDSQIEDLGGTAAERWLLELKAGLARGWDANHIPDQLYVNNELSLFQKKFDIWSMANAGVLAIPPQIVDPVQRNVVVITSNLQVVAYNKKLLAPKRIPDRWEDFLKPEFKGRKFVAEIDGADTAGLIPAWGLEKTIDFARKLAAQQPIWSGGASRALVSMIAGEYALFLGPNFHTVKRAQDKDRAGILGLKILEPVPTRLTQPVGVMEKAEHPYAGLLWVEFQAGPKGQQILDKFRPYGGSVFVPGSISSEVTRGKQLSVVNWDHFSKMSEYKSKIVEAYGFPRAEKK